MNATSGAVMSPFFASLPEDKQRIIDAGYNLFELAKIVQNWQGNCPDYGYFDVVVEDYTAGFPPKLYFRERWHRGPNAYIRYMANKRGFCFAFCPDDHDWYNRIQLAANIHSNIFRIERLHTREGIISGKRATEEIMFIRELTHRWVLRVNGKSVYRSMPDKREECEARAAEFKARGERPQIIWGKTEEIENQIKAAGSNWFFTDEFKNKIKPALVEKVAERFSGDNDKVAKLSMLEQIVGTLDPREVIAVLERAVPAAGRAPVTITTSTEATPAPAGSGLSVEEITDMATLRSFAKNLGIKVTQAVKKEELRALIKDEIAKRAEDAKIGEEDEAGVQAPMTEGENSRYDTGNEVTDETIDIT